MKKIKERLTQEEWKEIEFKKQKGFSIRRLAREYHVAYTTIQRHFHKSSWKFWKK